MASNSPFSSGASSILSGAASRMRAVQDFQDSEAAFNYRYSGYTDAAYQDYSQYLKNRINTLSSSTLISDAQKALTLQSTLQSATHSNISASITRENIQIMSGNATPTDKYNLISLQYVRAVNNGDYTLAQSLMSQAYSLSQTIQADAVTAANAAVTVAKSNASATAKGYSDTATALKDQLKTFNTDVTNAGASTLSKVTSDFVKKITPQLNELGIYLKDGAQPNYFDIVQGVNQAMYKYYGSAADALRATNPEAADSYAQVDASGNLIGGKAYDALQSIPTAFGAMSVQDLMQAQNNPNSFHLKQDPQFIGNGKSGSAGGQNPQVGYNFVPGTGVVPELAEHPWVDVPNDAAAQIQQLGLKVLGGKAGSNGVEVAATDPGKNNPGTPDWLKAVIPPNSTLHLVYGTNNVVDGPNGVKYNPNIVQFEADAKNGTGKAVYTITKDNQGRQAVYESSNLGDRLVGSDVGYNPNPQLGNQTQNKGPFVGDQAGNLTHTAKGPGFDNFFNMGSGAHDIITAAGQRQSQITADNAKAAAAMLAQAPPPLPNISMAPPAPLPNISTAPVPTSRINIPSYPNPAIAPHTVNPQQPNLSVQAPSGFNLQGGGGIRLQ